MEYDELIYQLWHIKENLQQNELVEKIYFLRQKVMNNGIFEQSSTNSQKITVNQLMTELKNLRINCDNSKDAQAISYLEKELFDTGVGGYFPTKSVSRRLQEAQSKIKNQNNLQHNRSQQFFEC
ncbi:hypothetical protein BH739_01310 [Enterococcus casseliflavus]|nr:hypothetical protein BH739_01310 [Enterococcus casseliflavus]